MNCRQWVIGLSLIGVLACNDDEEAQPTSDGGADSGTPAPVDSGIDASAPLDAGHDAGSDAGTDAGSALALKIERGRYLVENVGACGDCHTPRGAGGVPDLSKKLGGVDCFAGSVDGPVCLSARNLTNHETGLKNRSDQEIKDLFLKGKRPDGTNLHPVMPYYVLGNMSDADADAIVAFLRTVPGIDHMVKAPTGPFANVPEAAPRWPDMFIPQPSPSYPDQEAAKRGRYLAGSFGICMECHTPQLNGAPDVTRAFEGTRAFKSHEELGLPEGLFPETIYSSNLTPDATGIQGYDVAKLVKAIKQGSDKDNKPLCPPMPAGAMQAFAGITDADATDIAHYLLSLAPKANALPNTCDVPAGP